MSQQAQVRQTIRFGVFEVNCERVTQLFRHRKRRPSFANRFDCAPDRSGL